MHIRIPMHVVGMLVFCTHIAFTFSVAPYVDSRLIQLPRPCESPDMFIITQSLVVRVAHPKEVSFVNPYMSSDKERNAVFKSNSFLFLTYMQLPSQLKVRLQACVDWLPPLQTREEAAFISSNFLKWLQRLQFKMGQIELQSSAATQFYSV